MNRSYLLISPCRDEQDYAQWTIDSVVAQDERPTKWIIVDDGSTDTTPDIIARAALDHDWIEVLTRPARTTRILGSGVVHAFNDALRREDLSRYGFVSKLDMDLILPPTYYATLLDEMEHSPRLGTASGRPHIAVEAEPGGTTWEPERGAVEMSAGMAKLYRLSAFEEIGGLVPELMWDGIDCHEARIQGWTSRSFDLPATDFKHLRPEGGSDRGVLRGRRRHGYGQWYMGTDPLFMLASAALRVADDPKVSGSAAMLRGYLGAARDRVRQHGDRRFRSELRRFQRESLVLGKTKATQRWETRTAVRWSGRTDRRAVAYLVSQHPTRSHTFIDTEIDALEQIGWTVHVFSARHADPDVPGLDRVTVLQERSADRLVEMLTQFGLEPVAALRAVRETIGPHGGPPRRPIGLAYLAQALCLLTLMEERGLTHVHVHFANNASEIARLAVYLDRLRGPHRRYLTWSVTVHGLWMHGMGQDGAERFPQLNARRWGPLADRLCAADAVFTIDEAARARLQELVGPGAAPRITTLHMGVDTTRFTPRGEPRSGEPFTVLFVGRLAPEKSLDTLLEAFAALRLPIPPQLRIVGGGDCEADLRAQATALGIADRVTFLGPLPPADCAQEYRRADAFAMTSRSEGIPVVLMEAMASGLPVVAPAVGGIPELVEDGSSGIVVMPGDVTEVTTALQELAADPQRRARYGAAGRAHVQAHFDVRASAALLDETFTRLTRPRRLTPAWTFGALGGAPTPTPAGTP